MRIPFSRPLTLSSSRPTSITLAHLPNRARAIRLRSGVPHLPGLPGPPRQRGTRCQHHGWVRGGLPEERRVVPGLETWSSSSSSSFPLFLVADRVLRGAPVLVSRVVLPCSRRRVLLDARARVCVCVCVRVWPHCSYCRCYTNAPQSEGTTLSGSISTVLTVLSWICVGIHSRRALPSPVCA